VHPLTQHSCTYDDAESMHAAAEILGATTLSIRSAMIAIIRIRIHLLSLNHAELRAGR
jgi:hypothetical protein